MTLHLHTLARECFEIACKRHQTQAGQSLQATCKSIQDELDELIRSTDDRSEHIPNYTNTEEELADILICCLTELYARGCPVDNIVRDKINCNRNRI